MTVFKRGTTIGNFIAGINANFSELLGKLTHCPVSYKTLFEGSVSIPSKSNGTSSTIALSDNITSFDGIIIQREGCSAWQNFETISIGRTFKAMNLESDFEFMEGCNLYMCNVQVASATSLIVSNNVYSGVKTSATARYIEGFTERPITKIIGIKLN